MRSGERASATSRPRRPPAAPISERPPQPAAPGLQQPHDGRAGDGEEGGEEVAEQRSGQQQGGQPAVACRCASTSENTPMNSSASDSEIENENSPGERRGDVAAPDRPVAVEQVGDRGDRQQLRARGTSSRSAGRSAYAAIGSEITPDDRHQLERDPVGDDVAEQGDDDVGARGSSRSGPGTRRTSRAPTRRSGRAGTGGSSGTTAPRRGRPCRRPPGVVLRNSLLGCSATNTNSAQPMSDHRGDDHLRSSASVVAGHRPHERDASSSVPGRRSEGEVGHHRAQRIRQVVARSAAGARSAALDRGPSTSASPRPRPRRQRWTVASSRTFGRLTGPPVTLPPPGCRSSSSCASSTCPLRW